MSTTARVIGPTQAGVSVISPSMDPPADSATTPQGSTNFTVVDDPGSLSHRRICPTLYLSIAQAWVGMVTSALGVFVWFRRDGAGSSWTTTLLSKLQALWTNKCNLVGKTIVLLTLIVACLALWPTFAASGDGRKALLLAEWEAKKDYFELCESHDWDLPGCNETMNNPLGPPPVVRSDDSVAIPSNGLDGNAATPDVSSVSALVAFMSFGMPAVCCIVVLFRRRAVRQNLLRFCARLARQEVNAPPHMRQSHVNESRDLDEPLPVVFGTSSSFDFTFNVDRSPQGLSRAPGGAPLLTRRRKNVKRESSEPSLNYRRTSMPPHSTPEPPVDARDNETHVPPYVPPVNPFSDDSERLIVSIVPRYTLPENGQVNGYVKFNWPSRALSRWPSTTILLSSEDDVEETATNMTQLEAANRRPSTMAIFGPVPVPSMLTGGTVSPVSTDSTLMAIGSSLAMPTSSPIKTPESSSQLMTINEPRMLPPQFGFQTKMDHLDRCLFEFYTKNWCPGRSVLIHTNPWLRDVAPMHKNEGILYAIQSLAGIYIYDYLPHEHVRQRVNERYVMAMEYYRKLLVAPGIRRIGGGDEVITMAVILSMQDIVLTERRLNKPSLPRWFEGFKQGELFLQKTDPGGRYWKKNNIQYSNLRISQSIIVGQGVILAQSLMVLPSKATLNPEEEAGRFSWLLYGTEKDIYEVHGGCGFSKKLLHAISQVTYCMACLQQKPDCAIIPITAKFLYRELLTMRQWSREGVAWKEAYKSPQTIEWVRSQPDNTIIDSNQEMTNVTAEAWRITAIIYMQCRLLRLPRNHPEVVANMTDLAKCIRIMPTSGPQFTAQAPLLPVFFLGMLATVPEHQYISQGWFEEVVRTPVRSSVPPLYQALKRIWAWIDTDVEIPSAPTVLAESISQRDPWWENLVASVRGKEDETLCLT